MSTADSTAATWSVDSQNQRTMVTAGNQIVDGYEVAFHTGQGHVGTVFVPDTKYTPDNVKAMIQARADLLDSVGQLTHDS